MSLGSFAREKIQTAVEQRPSTTRQEVQHYKEGFTAKVTRFIGDVSAVKANPKKVTLEIRDLDPLTSEEEVLLEISRALQNEQTKPEVKILKPNPRGLKLAEVVLSEVNALWSIKDSPKHLPQKQ